MINMRIDPDSCSMFQRELSKKKRCLMDVWALELCSQSGIDCSCEVMGGYLSRFLLFPVVNNEYDSLWPFVL